MNTAFSIKVTDQARRMTKREEARWEEKYCKRRKVRFWGSDSRVKPVLVPIVFGDGKQPIWLQPLATRPQYYVLAGHSGWSLDNRGEDAFCDHLESVYQSIEERFGSGDDDRYEDETKRQWERRTAWPALDTSYGCAWEGYAP